MMRAWRLSDVCLSRTSGLSRGQRGIERLKSAQRKPTSHVTRTPRSRSKGQRSTCRGGGILWRPPTQLVTGSINKNVAVKTSMISSLTVFLLREDNKS